MSSRTTTRISLPRTRSSNKLASKSNGQSEVNKAIKNTAIGKTSTTTSELTVIQVEKTGSGEISSDGNSRVARTGRSLECDSNRLNSPRDYENQDYGDMDILSQRSTTADKGASRSSSLKEQPYESSVTTHMRKSTFGSRLSNRGHQIEESSIQNLESEIDNREVFDWPGGSAKDSGYAESHLSQDSDLDSYSEGKIGKSVSFDRLSSSNQQWSQPREISFDLTEEFAEDEAMLKEELLKIFERERSSLELHCKHKMEVLMARFRRRQMEVEEAAKMEKYDMENDIAHEKAEMKKTFAEEIAKLTHTFNSERAELECYYKKQIQELRAQFEQNQIELDEKAVREKNEQLERLEAEYQARMRMELSNSQTAANQEIAKREEEQNQERLEMERKFQMQRSKAEMQVQNIKRDMESSFEREKYDMERQYREKIKELEERLEKECETRSQLDKVMEENSRQVANMEHTRKAETEELQSKLEMLRIELDEKNKNTEDFHKTLVEVREKGIDGLSGPLREEFDRCLELHKQDLERNYLQEKEQLKNEKKRLEEDVRKEKAKLQEENARERDEIDEKKVERHLEEEKLNIERVAQEKFRGPASDGGYSYRIEGTDRPRENHMGYTSAQQMQYDATWEGSDQNRSLETFDEKQNYPRESSSKKVIPTGSASAKHNTVGYSTLNDSLMRSGRLEEVISHPRISARDTIASENYTLYQDETSARQIGHERVAYWADEDNKPPKTRQRLYHMDLEQEDNLTVREQSYSHTSESGTRRLKRSEPVQIHHGRSHSIDKEQERSYSSNHTVPDFHFEQSQSKQDELGHMGKQYTQYVSADNEDALRNIINELRQENVGLKAKMEAMEENISLHKTYKCEAKDEIARLQKAKNELLDELQNQRKQQEDAKRAQTKVNILEEKLKVSEKKTLELEAKIQELMGKLEEAYIKTKTDEQKCKDLDELLQQEKVKSQENTKKTAAVLAKTDDKYRSPFGDSSRKSHLLDEERARVSKSQHLTGYSMPPGRHLNEYKEYQNHGKDRSDVAFNNEGRIPNGINMPLYQEAKVGVDSSYTGSYMPSTSGHLDNEAHRHLRHDHYKSGRDDHHIRRHRSPGFGDTPNDFESYENRMCSFGDRPSNLSKRFEFSSTRDLSATKYKPSYNKCKSMESGLEAIGESSTRTGGISDRFKSYNGTVLSGSHNLQFQRKGDRHAKQDFSRHTNEKVTLSERETKTERDRSRDMEGVHQSLRGTVDVSGCHGDTLGQDAVWKIERKINDLSNDIRRHLLSDEDHCHLSSRTDHFNQSGDEAMRILHLQMDKQELEMKLSMAKQVMSDYVRRLNDQILELQENPAISEATLKELLQRKNQLNKTMHSLEQGQMRSDYQNDQLRKQTSEMQSLIGQLTKDMAECSPSRLTVTGGRGDGYYNTTSYYSNSQEHEAHEGISEEFELKA